MTEAAFLNFRSTKNGRCSWVELPRAARPSSSTNFRTPPPHGRGQTREFFHVKTEVGAAFAGISIIVAATMFISWMIAFFIAKPPSREQTSTRENVRSSWLRAAWTLVSFTSSGAIIGLALGSLLYLTSELKDPQVLAFVLICFGSPIVVSAYFIGEMFHIGVTSYIKWGDGERGGLLPQPAIMGGSRLPG